MPEGELSPGELGPRKPKHAAILNVRPMAAPKSFIWTDSEVELLLRVVNEYRVNKISESVDWETVHNKYADILSLFIFNFATGLS